MFQDGSLSVTTKHAVYKAVVLGTLLYGSETWITKFAITQKMETFHSRCLRGIFSIKELVEEMVMMRQMRWLGHVARMDNNRMSKQALFGHLSKARLFHGVKMRCKDRIRKDMASLSITSGWYRLAQNRKK